MNVKIKAVLAYVVIFLVGGASGYFLNEAISPQYAPFGQFDNRPGLNNNEFQRPGDGPGFGRERMQNRMASFLARRLDLSENQREPFFKILDDHLNNLQSRITEQRDEEVEMVRNLYSGFLDKAEEILTQQQIQELNQIAHPDSVHQRRMQRRHERRGFR